MNEKVKTMQESWPFLRPVNRKLVKDYYAVIKHPVDIELIEKKVKCECRRSRWLGVHGIV